MAEKRYVVRADRDSKGNINGICWDREIAGKGSLYTDKDKAMAEIDAKKVEYVVAIVKPETVVRVVDGRKPPYLRTEADSTSKNNLDNLNQCSKAKK